MTFRDSYADVEGEGHEALRRSCIPLFTVMIGLLAALNIASVVFVLLG